MNAAPCRSIVLLAGLLAVVHSPAAAQPIAGTSSALHARMQLGSPEGPLRAALRRETAALAAQRSTAPNPDPDPTPSSSWWSRHPVLAGALIGTGGGAVLSRVDAIGGQSHDPRVALIGTAAGAWGGLIASAVQKSRRHEKVPAGTKALIAGGAVSLVVVPYLTCYAAGGCRE